MIINYDNSDYDDNNTNYDTNTKNDVDNDDIQTSANSLQKCYDKMSGYEYTALNSCAFRLLLKMSMKWAHLVDMGSVFQMERLRRSCQLAKTFQWPLLLTWFNLNSSMYK